MNKQEVIEEIKNLEGLTILDKTINFDSEMIPKKEAFNIINQLDEPEKPVVPECVAEWFENSKGILDWCIIQLCLDIANNVYDDNEIHTWFSHLPNKPIQTLVKMKLYGYRVEEKILYEVFLKRNGVQLGVCIPDGEDKAQFTEEELKEFEFDNLDVYEVKEVEE